MYPVGNQCSFILLNTSKEMYRGIIGFNCDEMFVNSSHFWPQGLGVYIQEDLLTLYVKQTIRQLPSVLVNPCSLNLYRSHVKQEARNHTLYKYIRNST